MYFVPTSTYTINYKKKEKLFKLQHELEQCQCVCVQIVTEDMICFYLCNININAHPHNNKLRSLFSCVSCISVYVVMYYIL